MKNKSRAARPNKALKGRKTIAQGKRSATLGTRDKKTSTRGLDARAKSHSPLRDPIWAVISDELTIIGLKHRKAVQVSREINGVVATNAAAKRQSEFATQ